MTKLELIAIAKELGLTKLSTMNKAELEVAIAQAQNVENPYKEAFGNDNCDIPATEYEQEPDYDDTMAQDANSIAPQAKSEPLSDFVIRSAEKDQEILANIEKICQNVTFAKTSSQINYIKLLECNFKVKVDYTKIVGELAIAQKIIEIHNAIRCGKVARRTQSESKARYRAMKAAQYTTQAHREVAMTSVAVDKTNIDVKAIAKKVLAQKHTAEFNTMIAKSESTNPVVKFLKSLLGK